MKGFYAALFATIAVLLYFALGSAAQAGLVFACVPLALVGGALALLLRGMPFSVSAAVGFIAGARLLLPATRRQGIARALLDAAADFARGDGAARISLETGRDNAAARATYRAAGWQEDDTQWYSLALR